MDFHYLQECRHQYLKILGLVLLKLDEAISNEIEPNIFLPNSSILMNFNRADKLMLNKYGLQIILQICLPKHCLHQLLRNWYMELACVVFVNYMIDTEVSFRGSKILNGHMCTVLFFLLPDFIPLGFTGKVLMRQF